MNREINGVPTAEFLWKEKNVVSVKSSFIDTSQLLDMQLTPLPTSPSTFCLGSVPQGG